MKEECNEAQRRIGLVSRRFAGACLGLMFGLPFAAVFFWVMVEPASLGTFFGGGGVPPIPSLTPTRRGACLVLELVAVLPMLLGLNHLRGLFLLYAAGVMFGERNVVALRGFGWSLILFAVTQALRVPAITLMLTFDRPAGQRFLSVGVDTGMLVAGVVGGVLLVIAWVMNEARLINEEQQFTI